MKHQYYIEVDTYWQGSKSYFVGPFAKKSEALLWINQEVPEDADVWPLERMCAGDIRSAWRYREPIAKSHLRYRLTADAVISPSTIPTAANLCDAVRQLRNL